MGRGTYAGKYVRLSLKKLKFYKIVTIMTFDSLIAYKNQFSKILNRKNLIENIHVYSMN